MELQKKKKAGDIFQGIGNTDAYLGQDPQRPKSNKQTTEKN